MYMLQLSVVALAVAICSGYIPGNEYTYSVEGQMLHEFAKKQHQHAGYKFQSTLIVQVKKGSSIMKIENSKSALVNEVVTEGKETEYKPTPADAEHDLYKPFEIVHNHGLVTEIKVAKDDPLWSVNIKKALATKLQLNFERVNLVEDHHHDNHKNGTHFENKYNYKSMEDGIHGECGKEYVIDDSEHNEIHVTKTTDFMSCKQISYRWYSNQNSESCYECGNHIYSPLQLSEVAHYTLKGDRKNFVTEKLTVEERFTYAPHGLDPAEYLKGDSRIKMELEDVKVVETELHVGDDAVTHHDLHYQFEEHEEVKDAEDLKKEPHHFYNFIVPKIAPETTVQMIDKISAIHDDEPYTEIYKDKNLPTLFMQLGHTMGTLTYDELDQIYKTHIFSDPKDTSEEARHKRMLFLNALLYAGTSASFMFVKHIVTEGNAPRHVVMFALGQLPNNLKSISPVLIEEFYTMCEHPKVHDNMHTRKICYLAFSKFVHDKCVAHYHNIDKKWHSTEKPRCTPETAEHYFDKMVKTHEGHAKDSLERILCIKTAGNFGTRESLHYLRKVMHDHHLPTYFRFSAIWSFHHQSSYYPEEVISLMMPIYFNVSEPHEIRIAALTAIMQSDPKLHHLVTIAENIPKEPNHQVAHYTMTLLKGCSEGASPCHKLHAGMCKRVLRYLKRVDFRISHDFRHSFEWFTNGYDAKWKLGGDTFFNFITSNDSYVPQQASFGMANYNGMTVAEPFEVGYVGYGLDKVFDRIIGQIKQHKSVLSLFKRKTRDTNIAEKELKEIDEKLPIETRVPEPIYADFYIDAFGSEINFFHFNDSTFQSMFKHGGNFLGELMNTLKDVSKYTTKNFFTGKQFKFVMPSILGNPIFVDISEAHFLYYRNNNFKFNVNPNPLAEGSDDSVPTTINLKVDGHLVHEENLYVFVGGILPKLDVTTGAGLAKSLYHSNPMKLKMAIEPKTPKVVVKYTPIMPHTLLKRTFHPFTIIHNNKEPTSDIKQIIKPYLKPGDEKKVEKDFLHDYLGYGLHFKGKFGKLSKLANWGSFWKFIAETDMREKIYYLSQNPLAVDIDHEISITPAANDPTTEVDTILNFDHFGYDTNSDKLYKPDFPLVQDGFENYINSRGDRKASTCVMKLEREFKGTKSRTLVTEMSYTHTFDNLYHKFNLHYDRSPFSPTEKDHYKICHSSSIMFPHVDMKKLYELDTVEMDPKIKVATDIHFGKNCENDKKITIRGEMSRTEEHKHMQAHRENPEENCPHTNADAYYYNKCKKDIADGFHYDGSCRKYWYRALKLRHYSLDIEAENLNAKDKYMIHKLDNCLKNSMMYYVSDHHNQVANDSDKIHIEADFSAKTDHVDLKIRKPTETTKFTHVPHPHWIQARSATPFFEFTNKMKRWSYFRKPFCFVEGDNVHTFDDVLFKLPPIDCYKVIAKDCSHKELFTVLGKNIKHNKHEKAVKVFLKKWKIEALPVSEDSEIIVRVNGQALPVTEAEPHFHYENFKGTDVLMFSISFNGLQYVIKSEQLGVTVHYGGTAIVVNLNPYYRGKQCGLCGDFNNNDLHDFVGPKNCVYHNATDFAASYAIPEDDCHIPPITGPCEHHQL